MHANHIEILSKEKRAGPNTSKLLICHCSIHVAIVNEQVCVDAKVIWIVAMICVGVHHCLYIVQVCISPYQRSMLPWDGCCVWELKWNGVKPCNKCKPAKSKLAIRQNPQRCRREVNHWAWWLVQSKQAITRSVGNLASAQRRTGRA